MPSERSQRHIDRMLDEADKAMAQRDWAAVRQLAKDVLDLDPGNVDALDFLSAMERKVETVPDVGTSLGDMSDSPLVGVAASDPKSFASGRYAVNRFLGEGGKFAIGEFREMKMQPSLERALRRKEVLKA